MRNFLAAYARRLPLGLRTYILPIVYGLFGGLAAVAFQKGTSIIFSFFWEKPSQQMPPSTFGLSSLLTILAASIIAGLILTFVSHTLLGDDPAFVIPSIGPFSNILYVLVIPTAGLAALAGVAFQKGL